MSSARCIAVSILIACAIARSQAQTTAATDAEITRRAAALLTAYSDTQLFSGAVLIARGDTVLYQGAAGLSNVEHRAGNTVDTPFRIAGITQLFTAAAVLRLQEQGKLKVTDTIGTLMPTWPAEYHPITVHQLLSGQSGVKDVTQIPEFVRSVALPRETQELAGVILKEPLATAPGTWARANNSNYHLLAAIVERHAGLAFPEFIKREIIARAGLTHTTHDDPLAVVPGRADGYMQSADGTRRPAWFHMNNAVGSANLISTVGDVHRFVRALIGGRVISTDSLAQMLTAHVPPQSLPGGAMTPGTGYGINVLENETASVLTSGGSIAGFQANLNVDRRSGIVIVVLSNIANSGGAFAMTNGLSAIAAGRDVHLPVKRTAVTPRAEDLAAVTGDWEQTSSFSIGADGTRKPTMMSFRVEGQRLYVRTLGGPEYEWFASGPGEFFARHLDMQVILDPANPDRATAVNGGRKGEMRRVKRSSATEE